MVFSFSLRLNRRHCLNPLRPYEGLISTSLYSLISFLDYQSLPMNKYIFTLTFALTLHRSTSTVFYSSLMLSTDNLFIKSFSRHTPYGICGGPEKDRDLCVCGGRFQVLSPRIRRANWMSFGRMVTLFAWMAQRFVSSNNPTKYASDASCRAPITASCQRRSVLKSCVISLTTLWNSNFLIRRFILF